MNDQEDPELFCRQYFELVILVLTATFPFKLSKQDFLTKNDMDAIEFFLKLAATGPISEKATMFESVYFFHIRMDRIRNGNEEELRYLSEEITEHALFIGRTVIDKLHELIASFRKRSTT